MNGYIGNNNVYRSNKNLQHTYINKRFVKSKVILDAINEAYKSIIPIGKHAVCFLNISINPAKIDVNIHPTKLEVKFEDEKDLYIQLRDYLRRRLLSSNLLGKYETYDRTSNPTIKVKEYVNKVSESSEPIEVVQALDNKPIDSFKSVNDVLNKQSEVHHNTKALENIDSILKEDNDLTKSLEKSIINRETTLLNEDRSFKLSKNDESINLIKNENEYIIEGSLDINKSFSIEELEELDKLDNLDENKSSKKYNSLYSNTLDDKIDSDINSNFDSDYINDSLNKESIQEGFFKEDEDKLSLNGYTVLGVVFNTYVVLQKGESMYLLDQHVAHEIILYEEYMSKFYKHDISMQMLLDPIVLELSTVDMLQVEKNLDLFMNFGFEIEIFGNNHIMIRCVPTTFGIPESEKFILQIIDNIDEIKNNYELKGEKFASMACRAAIKANDKIHKLEIDSLISQLNKCENPFTCPHGRPIVVEISKKEIEKMFKRIM